MLHQVKNANTSFFSDAMVAKHSIYDHDLRKEIKILVKLLFLFYIIQFNMMKHLAIIQVKAGKFVIKESHSAR